MNHWKNWTEHLRTVGQYQKKNVTYVELEYQKEKEREKNIWSNDTHQTTDSGSTENFKQNKLKTTENKTPKRNTSRYIQTAERQTQWLNKSQTKGKTP